MGYAQAIGREVLGAEATGRSKAACFHAIGFHKRPVLQGDDGRPLSFAAGGFLGFRVPSVASNRVRGDGFCGVFEPPIAQMRQNAARDWSKEVVGMGVTYQRRKKNGCLRSTGAGIGQAAALSKVSYSHPSGTGEATLVGLERLVSSSGFMLAVKAH